jgi:hypothetical protein
MTFGPAGILSISGLAAEPHPVFPKIYPFINLGESNLGDCDGEHGSIVELERRQGNWRAIGCVLDYMGVNIHPTGAFSF